MSQSITYYVNVSVALEGSGAQPAGFGVPLLVHEQDALPDRLAGPFSSAADVIDYGFAAGSPPHVFAQALMAQQPRVTSFYIGRRATTDADIAAALDAIIDVNPGAWYCAMEETREIDNIIGLADWIESADFPKIGLAQSNDASMLTGVGPTYTATFGGIPVDGTYRLIFTGFGLVAPVEVDVTRAAGIPATNAALGTAMAAALTVAATGPLGSLFGEVVLLSIVDDLAGEVTFQMVDGLAAGTITVTDPESPDGLVVAIVDGDPGSMFFQSQYTRTSLWYHPIDAEFLDGSVASRCLSFDLDARKGIWAYKRLNGIDATSLTNVQVAALRATNTNYYAPAVMSAGTQVSGFTAMGWMPSGTTGAGRRIDITTSMDWSKARLEEALVNVLLRETHGVPYDDSGINRFASAATGVFSQGVDAGHFVRFKVPEGEDGENTMTPVVIVPTFAQVLAADRTARTLSFSGLAYLRQAIERVVFALTLRQ